MTYERRIDRVNPALVLLMVDQSESMDEHLAGSDTSKATAVAEQLNGLIHELVLRCVKTPREPPRPYFALAAIGYSTAPDGSAQVVSLLPGSGGPILTTTELAEMTLRVDRRPAAASGGFVSFPVWVEPAAHGGTPMCAAFDVAGRLCAGWASQHPHSFPPLVLNLTDGESTDGQPLEWARRLRALGTSDGTTLLFNLNLAAHPAQPTLFPAAPDGLPTEFSQTLFQMSSQLPPAMLDAATSQGIAVAPGARGFAYNADIRTLAQFLNVGTSIGRSVR